MTFDTFAELLRQRLTNLGYKTKSGDCGDLFYIENYFNSTNLFKIDYKGSNFHYAANPTDQFWTPSHNYTFSNLKALYVLAKKYYIDAKEKKIKDKLNEINKDFQ